MNRDFIAGNNLPQSSPSKPSNGDNSSRCEKGFQLI